MKGRKAGDASPETVLAGVMLLKDIFALIADPYTIWKLRYTTAIIELSLVLTKPRTTENVQHIRDLETELTICDHYRRENNFHVMRRRLLAERCEG